MTSEQRVHYDNGVWLCAAHSPLVDKDWPKYSGDELRKMKRTAEAKAAENLEHARIKANLEPILDGGVDWREPAPNETRPGYRGLHHAVFRLGGSRKQRGRVFIDVLAGDGKPNRTQAYMGEGTDFVTHELGALRPGQPYLVPVFTVIQQTSKFWLDRRLVPDHPFWHEPPQFTLAPGTYVTDGPFLDLVHRQPLLPGTYKLAVVVIIGDTEHQRTFSSAWKEISVAL